MGFRLDEPTVREPGDCTDRELIRGLCESIRILAAAIEALEPAAKADNSGAEDGFGLLRFQVWACRKWEDKARRRIARPSTTTRGESR